VEGSCAYCGDDLEIVAGIDICESCLGGEAESRLGRSIDQVDQVFDRAMAAVETGLASVSKGRALLSQLRRSLGKAQAAASSLRKLVERRPRAARRPSAVLRPGTSVLRRASVLPGIAAKHPTE
jgi:hypothetical protein